MSYTVPEEEKAHYNALREARGWTWELLAEDFERANPDDGGAKYLAAWAREQAGATKRGRKGAERATAEPPEKR